MPKKYYKIGGYEKALYEEMELLLDPYRYMDGEWW
jgi:hypothetical protein